MLNLIRAGATSFNTAGLRDIAGRRLPGYFHVTSRHGAVRAGWIAKE